MEPQTRYARSGEVSIAYQVVGEGPMDLLFVPGFVSNVELWWEMPAPTRFLERLASFSRLVVFDKRGTGLSDPVIGPATLEERIDDVRAVLDAVGIERVALLGLSEGGAMSALFAALYPERVSALVLLNSTARFRKAPDWPCGVDDALRDRLREGLGQWGEGVFGELWAPSVTDDDRLRHSLARLQRQSASPAMARALVELDFEIDIREALPTIQAPTLVLHSVQDLMLRIGHARATAALIPGSKLVELPRGDHLPWVVGADGYLDAIEEFLTGSLQARDPDRVLATVLFTDIVDSTRRAAELGDHSWRRLLQDYRARAESEVGRFRGRLITSTGDGHLAAFDGPARAVRCAAALRDAVGELGLELRAGVHTGECELIGEDLAGLAVHIGARVGALAGAGEVLATSTVRDLVVSSGIEWDDRGDHMLRGVPGEWRVFAARV